MRGLLLLLLILLGACSSGQSAAAPSTTAAVESAEAVDASQDLDEAEEVAATTIPVPPTTQPPTPITRDHPWRLIGISPDGQTIRVAYGSNLTCHDRFTWEIDQSAELDEVSLLLRHRRVVQSGDQTAEECLSSIEESITLAAPLDGRALTGCQWTKECSVGALAES